MKTRADGIYKFPLTPNPRPRKFNRARWSGWLPNGSSPNARGNKTWPQAM